MCAALHTGEIDALGRLLVKPSNTRWLGTFARDKIPELSHQQRPCALVFNSDTSDKPGQHWLALYMSSSSKDIELFDSYGLPLSYYDLDFPFHVRSSSRSIQSVDTSVCGHYCIMFLLYRSSGHSFMTSILQIENKFSDKTVASTVLELASFTYHLSLNLYRYGQRSSIKQT